MRAAKIVTGALVPLAVLLIAVAGCGKKSTPAADPTASGQPAPAEDSATTASKLPGAKEIIAAVDRKDYDGAVASFLQLGRSVANEQQKREYAALADEIRVKLLEAGPSDPKVMEALSVIRKVTGGR